MSFRLVTASLLASFLYGAAPPCPAGMPLGTIQLTVERAHPTALSINRINQIDEGDRILYSPSLKGREKRSGSVALVLVNSRQDHEFVILDAKDADKPAHWTAPFRASLAVYVYGPSGLSTRKLKGFLSQDNELIAQLADYAQKTSQTEAVLQAISLYENGGHAESLGAALQGFAGQYGISNKIDRNAPMNEQTLSALRTLNPALSAYDPISPYGSQRVSQTTGLAATVAGMFLGSTVGLAAGSTALALNLKTLMFPDTDFRSAYSQASTAESVSLCTGREPQHSRKRIGYLWALRIPDSGPPKLKIEGANHVPLGLKSFVKLTVSDPQLKLVSRVRDWTLEPEQGDRIPVSVNAVADGRGLEILPRNVSAGKYKLHGSWDWDPLAVEGDLYVQPLSSFDKASLTAESQNRLQQHSGKQLITVEGPDFQFLDKAQFVSKSDKYATPVAVPFTLPSGSGQGPQPRVELQIDTTDLNAGEYSLLLFQRDGKPQTVDVRLLPAPPKLRRLPLTVNEGESDTEFTLEGEGLDRITEISADGLEIELGSIQGDSKRRAGRIRQVGELNRGAAMNLRVSVKDYPQPLVFANALAVAGPRPRIKSADPSLPSDLQIELRRSELPAGITVGIMLSVVNAGSEPAAELGCSNMTAPQVKVQSGSETNGVRLQGMQANSLFLSLDPGFWPSGCLLTAVLHSKEAGKSEARDLGRVVRLPRIDSFQLTDESAGDNTYVGVLTGSDLELIGQVGWNAETGKRVLGLPVPIVGEGSKQSLKIQLPWPSPTPRAPLYIWFRGEGQGRPTKIR